MNKKIELQSLGDLMVLEEQLLQISQISVKLEDS